MKKLRPANDAPSRGHDLKRVHGWYQLKRRLQDAPSRGHDLKPKIFHFIELLHIDAPSRGHDLKLVERAFWEREAAGMPPHGGMT